LYLREKVYFRQVTFSYDRHSTKNREIKAIRTKSPCCYCAAEVQQCRSCRKLRRVSTRGGDGMHKTALILLIDSPLLRCRRGPKDRHQFRPDNSERSASP
jgi:hypothetical protein